MIPLWIAEYLIDEQVEYPEETEDGSPEAIQE
jgi:hypothetical protein